MKPLFISRDGVINKRMAGGVSHRTQLELIPGSIETVARLSKQGYTIIMVTHQPGLSRGLFDLDELEAIHAKIADCVEQQGGCITAIFYCPHDADDYCYCRPPATGLLDVVGVELDCMIDNAFYFCDNDDELCAAKARGCIPILCDEVTTLHIASQSLN
ncbi:hypothetical protein AB835_05255 [Candidatus Endobugula sertula]|uniref:D,D-heptose 1,7-bisphosphate phosphatase n=1 Tax=Candidatus Endobugula sertula TaxID=62101 RepID=A0A1D2QRI9_9GAMM|nr:hypothetical protein AB835_05255 [Candidatus Endobugula sertula]